MAASWRESQDPGMCRECSPSRVAAEGWKGVSPPHLFLSHTLISVPCTEASNFASILLPLLVPMVVIVPAAVTRECISRKKRRR